MRPFRQVELRIAGNRYAIRSQADDNYIRDLSDYVNDKIEEVRKLTKAATLDRLAVLAALNIADEFFQERCENREMRSKIIERSETIMKQLDAFNSDGQAESLPVKQEMSRPSRQADRQAGSQADNQPDSQADSLSKAYVSSHTQRR